MRSKSTISGVLLLPILWSSLAFAQGYEVSSDPQPYAPLVGSTPLTDTSVPAWQSPLGAADPYDEGAATFDLGFAFKFHGTSVGRVVVHANGALFFDPEEPFVCDGSAAAGCTGGGRTFPTPTAAFHGIFAPWWTNARSVDPQATISFQRPAPPEVGLTIEYHLRSPGITPDERYSFQVHLGAQDTITVHYGPRTGGAESAVVGFEDLEGIKGGHYLPCGTSCTGANWPAGTKYTLTPPTQPDLTPSELEVTAVQVTDTEVSFTARTVIHNYGITDSGAFTWKVFLSRDQILDPSDIAVYESGSRTVPRGGQLEDFGAVRAPRPGAAGLYYVLVQVDATGAVAEFDETNNVLAAAAPFRIGLDLIAVSITGPNAIGGGESASLNLAITNQGTDDPPDVAFRVLLSSDALVDVNDFELYSGRLDLGAGEELQVPLNLSLPARLPRGDFFWLLEVNGDRVLDEADLTNNTVVSAQKTRVKLPDLELESFEVISDPDNKRVIGIAYFGQQGWARARISNKGEATALDFTLTLYVSTNGTFSRLSDTFAHPEPVAFVDAGKTVEVIFPFSLPLNDRTGKKLTTGNYFLFGILDLNQEVTESNEENNFSHTGGAIRMFEPSPDYLVSTVDAPASGAVGETIPVYRSLSNVGTVDGPLVSYRYFASANSIISTEDTPLPVISSSGALQESVSISIPKGTENRATDFVRLPGHLPPGAYYIGVIVDAANQAVEVDEVNNARASASRVQIVAPALSITTKTLPDASLDQPFQFQLAATGAGTGGLWSMEPSEGPLPPGVFLSPDGMIAGVPSAEGVFSFTARLNSGNREAAARLVLRVLPATGELIITTLTVPPFFVSGPQQTVTLAASGGVKPYRWTPRLDVIAGVHLTEEGLLTGTPRNSEALERELVLEVVDAVGSRATRTVTVRLKRLGVLAITTPPFGDLRVGQAIRPQDLVAQVSNQTQPDFPLEWEVVGGRLPPGLSLERKSGELTLIQGTPTKPGLFTFTLGVTDATARTDTADYLMRVFSAGTYALGFAQAPGILQPGDEVDLDLTSGLTVAQGLTFALTSGRLPAGLELTVDGHIRGQVALEGTTGRYSFVVESNDPSGSVGFGALTLVVEAQAEQTGGCASGGSAPLWLGLLLMGAWLGRRSRGLVAGASLAAVLLVGGVAQAQVTYDIQRVPGATYVPLDKDLTAEFRTNVLDEDMYATWGLPFDFYFFGFNTRAEGATAPNLPIREWQVSLHGYLTPLKDPATAVRYVTGTKGMGQVTSPLSFIAPCWGRFKRGDQPLTAILRTVGGTAPFRVATLEWQAVDFIGQANNPVSCMVQLYETTNAIRFSYGRGLPLNSSLSSSASHWLSGVQLDATYWTAYPNCGTSGSTWGKCDHNATRQQWPANQVWELTMKPDLEFKRIVADDLGYAGRPLRASVEVGNHGGRTGKAQVHYFLSTDLELDAADLKLVAPVVVQDVPVHPTVSTTIDASLELPADLAPGTYYLYARVESAPVAGQELRLDNNTSIAMPRAVLINPPTPDLVVLDVAANATSAVPGGTFEAATTIRNDGSRATDAEARYTYFLTDNTTTSFSDIALTPSATLPVLAKGAQHTAGATLQVPMDVVAGRYFVGVCVDYDPTLSPTSTVVEISEVNNCRTSEGSLVISTGGLAILSRIVPGAAQYSPYGFQLQATGGDGTFLWSLKEASTLPMGMTLSTEGYLSGKPSIAGSYTFTVVVTNGTASESQEASYTILVTGADEPLAVVAQDLPAAEFGRAYQVALRAVGGTPPYRWQLKTGAVLPVGLALSEEGLIEGRPTESRDQSYQFEVEIQDATGARSARTLAIQVVAPNGLRIATTRLATAVIKQNYAQFLQSVGSTAAPTWSLVAFQRLQESPTDPYYPPQPQKENGTVDFPAGFGLELTSDAAGRWMIRGSPAQAGLYSVTLKVADANHPLGRVATLLLKVTWRDAFAILTNALPDAFIGEVYGARFTHTGGAEVAAKYEVACLQEMDPLLTKSTCLEPGLLEKLPVGMRLEADGSLTGTPELARDESLPPEGRFHTFLVRVTDPQGRQDLRPMSIRLRPARSTGCSGTGLAPSALAALALAGLLRRGRNRS